MGRPHTQAEKQSLNYDWNRYNHEILDKLSNGLVVMAEGDFPYNREPCWLRLIKQQSRLSPPELPYPASPLGAGTIYLGLKLCRRQAGRLEREFT